MEENRSSRNGSIEHSNTKDGILTAKRIEDTLPDTKEVDDRPKTDLIYSLEDVPPWYLSLLLGIQQFLTMLGSTVTIPFVLCPALCIGDNDPARSYLTSTIVFVSGMITFIQTTFGIRLPIIQGGTFSLLVPTFTILNQPEWKCPDPNLQEMFTNHSNQTLGLLGTTDGISNNVTWQDRIRVIQGTILVATVFQLLISFTGLIGLMLRFVTPLTTTPVIALIGLALFENAAEAASGNWYISMLTVVLLLLFSLYLREWNIPLGCTYSKEKGCKLFRGSLFKLFPVLMSILIVWILCFILTETKVLPPNDPARTDNKALLMERTKWFRVPYPTQWGTPTVSVAGIFGFIGGLVASMLETIGDFRAAARMSGAPPPPKHAVNRGIFVEGIGNTLAAIWGTGNGTTAYAENIAVIGVTKVGSRRVIQAAGLVMMAVGLVSKTGALFVSIPPPVIGGVFFVMCSMMASVGLSNIQFVNMNSSRNLMVLGLPLFFGLAIPKWLAKHPGAIKTGYRELDDALEVILSTSMFIGGILGLILDNTVPASKEDRRVVVAGDDHALIDDSDENPPSCYDLPFGMNLLRKSTIAKYFPISPTYQKPICSCRKDKYNI